jgi:hypothetical protein
LGPAALIVLPARPVRRFGTLRVRALMFVGRRNGDRHRGE